MKKKSAGAAEKPKSLRRRDLKKLSDLERQLLAAIVRGLDPSCPRTVRESAVNACVRVSRERMFALYISQTKKHGGGLMDLMELADVDDVSKNREHPLSRRVCLAMARIFSSLNGHQREFEAPKNTAEAEPDPSAQKWEALHRVIDRAVVPLVQSTRHREQLRGLRAMEAVWKVAPPVGLWMVNCDSMWRNPLSRLSYLAMSTETRVQVAATRLIAQVATHPEGRDKVSDLVVSTLERLLDARSLEVQASAALVVSRQKFKDWHPHTPSGRRLLDACVRLVNAPKTEQTAREYGVEALSVLCLKYDAKERILKDAVSAVCDLSKTGNEESSHWLGIANVFHELSTSQHEKNAELGREMDVTAEQFETLQRINNMKKQSDQTENLDTESRIQERVASMVKAGACNALCRIACARSKRTRETVVRTMINFCKFIPVRGPLAAAGGVAVCTTLAKSPEPKVAHRAMTALARMLISVNPTMIRAHQLMDAVVPLLEMSRQEEDSLMQFEACLALTNLCSFSQELKSHVVAHDGIVQFEMLQTHQHKLVRRASTEAIHNLVPCEAVFDMFKRKGGGLLDWWTQLAEEESDFPTARAACGMLAMISGDPDIADLIVSRNLVGRMLRLLVDWDGEDEIALRVVALMENIVDAARPPGAGLKALRAENAVKILSDVEVEDESANTRLAAMRKMVSGST